MAYATVEKLQLGFRTLTSDEKATAEALLDEAAVIIDAHNYYANIEAKELVSCRMVRRSMGDGEGALFPIGTTQGSMSAGGYTQSFTMGNNGTSGELYISKLEKKMLGLGDRIGSHSPLEEACDV